MAVGTLADFAVTLHDADKWELAYNDNYGDSPASKLLWKAPRSGSYYIEVSGWNHMGSYTLTVVVSDIVDDHAGRVEAATPIGAGEVVPGVVDYPGDVDLFGFDAVEGELYQIDVALGTLADSLAVLFDADARELTYNDDYEGSSASRIVWEAPSSGSYYIAVGSRDDDTGSYTLTIIVR